MYSVNYAQAVSSTVSPIPIVKDTASPITWFTFLKFTSNQKLLKAMRLRATCVNTVMTGVLKSPHFALKRATASILPVVIILQEDTAVHHSVLLNSPERVFSEMKVGKKFIRRSRDEHRFGVQLHWRSPRCHRP